MGKIKKASHVLALIAIALIFTACNKKELSGIENSSLQIFGTKANGELKTILPTTDGGFIVCSLTWENNKRLILLQKFSKNFKPEWNNFLGEQFPRSLNPKLYIEKNGKILVTNNVYANNRDSITPMNYIYCLDPKGNLIWGNTIAASDTNVWASILDLVQNDEGDFILLELTMDGKVVI